MKSMSISKFKAQCLAEIERVRRTRAPLLVTRFGKPVAQLLPPPAPERPDGALGAMRGRGRIVGDIVSPAASDGDWKALRR